MTTISATADIDDLEFGESYVIDPGWPEPNADGQFDVTALDQARRRRDVIQAAVAAKFTKPVEKAEDKEAAEKARAKRVLKSRHNLGGARR